MASVSPRRLSTTRSRASTTRARFAASSVRKLCATASSSVRSRSKPASGAAATTWKISPWCAIQCAVRRYAGRVVRSRPVTRAARRAPIEIGATSPSGSNSLFASSARDDGHRIVAFGRDGQRCKRRRAVGFGVGGNRRHVVRAVLDLPAVGKRELKIQVRVQETGSVHDAALCGVAHEQAVERGDEVRAVARECGRSAARQLRGLPPGAFLPIGRGGVGREEAPVGWDRHRAAAHRARAPPSRATSPRDPSRPPRRTSVRARRLRSPVRGCSPRDRARRARRRAARPPLRPGRTGAPSGPSGRVASSSTPAARPVAIRTGTNGVLLQRGLQVMARRHVPDLVRDRVRELVLAVEQREQSARDVDLPARQRERVRLGHVHDPELVLEIGAHLGRARDEALPDLAQVALRARAHRPGRSPSRLPRRPVRPRALRRRRGEPSAAARQREQERSSESDARGSASPPQNRARLRPLHPTSAKRGRG